jgi:hypothetical protein
MLNLELPFRILFVVENMFTTTFLDEFGQFLNEFVLSLIMFRHKSTKSDQGWNIELFSLSRVNSISMVTVVVDFSSLRFNSDHISEINS